MSELNLQDLWDEADKEGALDKFVGWEPADGWTGIVTVIKANKGTTKNGHPRIGLYLEVQGGPDEGKKTWTNVTFTDKSTKVALAQLKALGLGREDLADGYDGIVAAVVGLTAKAKVKNDGQWVNFNFSRIEPDTPAAPPKELSFDDEDF